MAKTERSTDTELQVLKVLWSLGDATVAQVRERYNDENGTSLAYTTVMTLLTRLVAKKAVQVDRAREPFLYTAVSTRQAVLRSRLEGFLASVFDGQADELVLHLVDAEALSDEAVARLKSAISKKQKQKGGRS